MTEARKDKSANPLASSLGPDEYEALTREAAIRLDPDADLDAHALLFTLLRAANRVRKDHENTVFRPQGVSMAAYQVFFTLEAVGPIPPNELARLSSVSTASMSSLLNTLSNAGYVQRAADATDGRRVIVSLTEKGREKLRTLFAQNNARERQWANGLSRTEAVILTEALRAFLAVRPGPLLGSEGATEQLSSTDKQDREAL